MLYLEDYLEMIEHLPQELRDRFTEIREMDLTVQNNMDALEKKVKTFFMSCRRGEYLGVSTDHEFDRIKCEYYKVFEEADEKIGLAGQMYDLVDKYLRKLDNELYKFKCELEADHNGITELLEKRSLELDAPAPLPSTNTQKENRYRPRAEKRRDSSSSVRDGVPEKKVAVAHSGGVTPIAAPATGSGSYNLQHIGAGNAIAAAASQAIAATQQMQQGRRTASLKASYEAIHMGSGNAQGKSDLLGITGAALAAIERDGASNPRRQKKKYSSSSSSQSSNLSAVVQTPPAVPIVTAAVPSVPATPVEVEEPIVADADSVLLETAADGEWTYDPNEPKYCLCNQVSYGDMVACDNEDCPFEWFHYPCVGIQSPPKGKWYCPQCISSMRRRGSRKN